MFKVICDQVILILLEGAVYLYGSDVGFMLTWIFRKRNEGGRVFVVRISASGDQDRKNDGENDLIHRVRWKV